MLVDMRLRKEQMAEASIIDLKNLLLMVSHI